MSAQLAPAVGLRRVALADLTADERSHLARSRASSGTADRQQVRAILDSVRAGGDEAVRAANARFGGGLAAEPPVPLSIPAAELARAAERLDPRLRKALELMAGNIQRFHAVQVPSAEQWIDVAPGIKVGRTWRAIDRVAAYVPGGEAAYPSSLLMSAIPAALAGVRDLVVASPAARDGTVSAALLGAAGLAGVREFHVMGGAQAIAALAYGTETVAPVDKIVGPGNAWVTAAKLEVFAEVAVDMPAGPSEVMVLADDSADPAHVSADLLSQAEHGPDSAAVLVTTSMELADRVEAEIEGQLPALPRAAFLRSSLGSGGLILIAGDMDQAIAFVNDYAPEHLSVVLSDDEPALAAIRHAGSIFLGAYAPESAGDYATGSNHVLPTGRRARASGPLSVETFGKWAQVQRVDRVGLASIRDAVGVVAEAEGLAAHRRAVEIRFEDDMPLSGPQAAERD